MNLLDWHIALAEAVTGDTDALEARASTMEAGPYPAGHTVPALARAFVAFERKDFAAAIDLLEPLLPVRGRLGGSNAQIDLMEFTLLRAYILADRQDAADRLLAARRPGAVGVPMGPTMAGFH